jgi:hypothetical protein
VFATRRVILPLGAFSEWFQATRMGASELIMIFLSTLLPADPAVAVMGTSCT